MTLQEYVISLQNQNLSQEEIYTKVEEWKKNNPQPQVEEEVEKVVEEKPIPLTIASATEPIEPEIDVEEFDFKNSQNNVNKLETDLIQISGGDMEMDAMDSPNRIKMYLCSHLRAFAIHSTIKHTRGGGQLTPAFLIRLGNGR